MSPDSRGSAVPLRRRPGRPRICAPGDKPVSVRLDERTYNAACLKALREDRKLTDVIREALRRDLGIIF